MRVENTVYLLRKKNLAVLPVVIILLLFGFVIQAQAVMPNRIVVVPYYTEELTDVRDGGTKTKHYRRVSRYITNQFVRHGMEVINPTAAEYNEEENNRVNQRTRDNSPLAARALCKKYATDAAYVIWLKLKVRKSYNASGPVYEGLAIVEGEGYDSAGRDLGAGLAKTWKLSRTDIDVLKVDIEKQVGDAVGRILTAWSGKSGGSSVSKVVVGDTSRTVSTPRSSGNTAVEGGIIQRNIKKNESFINIRLDGATDYEIAEVFGKIVNTTTGVVSAKRYAASIISGNPQGSYVKWQVEIESTDPFRLQANIMKMIADVLDHGGELVLNGVPYRYTPAEVDLLNGIRVGQATSMQLDFVVDRERAMEREFSGRRDPYQKKGFE